MPENLRSRRVGVRFLWRCARDGILPKPAMRRIVAHRIVGVMPVVRKRLERTPDEIMRAAAEIGDQRGN